MATAKKTTRSTDPNVRKSPPFSASQFLVGHVSVGNDGNNWIIVESANGIKRWAPYKKSASTAKATSSSKVVSQFEVNDLFVKQDGDDNWKLFYIKSIEKHASTSNENVITISEIDTDITDVFLETTLQGFLDKNVYIYRYIPQVGDIILKDSLPKPLRITIDEIDSKTGLTTVSSNMSKSSNQTYTKKEFTRLLVNKGLLVVNFDPNTRSSSITASIKLNPLVKIGEVFEDPNGKLYTITNIDEKNNYVEFKDELVGIRGAYFDSINEAIDNDNWTLKPNASQSQSSTASLSSKNFPSISKTASQEDALKTWEFEAGKEFTVFYTLPKTNIPVFIRNDFNINEYFFAVAFKNQNFFTKLDHYLRQYNGQFQNVKVYNIRYDILLANFEFDPNADSFETRDALNDIDDLLYGMEDVRNGVQQASSIPATLASTTSSNVTLKGLEDLLASSGTLYSTLPKSGVNIYEFDNPNKNYQFYIQLDEYQDEYSVERFLREKIKNFESVKKVTIPVLRTGKFLHVIIEFDDTISISTRLKEIAILDNYLSGDLSIKPVTQASTTSSSVDRQLQEFVDGLSTNGSLYYTLPQTQLKVYQNSKFTTVYEFALELQPGQNVDSVKKSLIDYIGDQESIERDILIVNPTNQILLVTFKFRDGYRTSIKKEDLDRVDNYLFKNIGVRPSITPSTAMSSNISSKFKEYDLLLTADEDNKNFYDLNFITSVIKDPSGSNNYWIEFKQCVARAYDGGVWESDLISGSRNIYPYIPKVGDIIAIKYKGNPDLTIKIVNIDLSNNEIEVESSDPRSTNNSYYTKEQFNTLLIERGISLLNFNPNATKSTVQEAEAKIDDIVFSAPIVPVGTEDQRNATDKLVDEFIAKNQNNLKKLAVENVGLLSTIDKTLEFIKAKFGTPAPVTSVSNVVSTPSQTQPSSGIDDYKLVQFIGEDGERKVIEFKKFKTGKNANVFKYLIGDVFVITNSYDEDMNYRYAQIIGAQEGGVRSGYLHIIESYPGKFDQGLTWSSRVEKMSVSEFEGNIESKEWEFVPSSNQNLKQLNALASQTPSSRVTTTKKRSFNLGDKVMISKSSKFYGSGDSNPKNVEGEVIDISNSISFPIKVKWANGKSNTYPKKDLVLVVTTSTTATPAPAVTTSSSGSTTANVGDTVKFYASREKTNLTGIVKSIITGTDGKPYLRINVNGKFYLKQQGSVTKV